jgi:hypothetical protein
VSLAPRVIVLALICASFAVALPASAATTIGNVPSSTSAQCAWGYPNSATYGQTIVAPSGDEQLDSFSFYVTQFRDPLTDLPSGDPATITYSAYVYEWDGQKAVGPSVWQSPSPQTLTTGATQEVKTETGGVALEPGVAYVLFLSVSAHYASNAAIKLAG